MTFELMTYRDGEQLLEAAVAFPQSVRIAPAVLVAHQWGGRGEGEHRAIERLAQLGYVGVAIDVYGKGVQGDPAGDNTHLMAPWAADRASLLRRLNAGVQFARSLERVNRDSVAAIGYCFGGLCVLDLARSGADLSGVVSLHGTLDDNGLEPDGRISAKVLAAHGWLDPLTPPERILAFTQEMRRRDADWQLHVYGQAMHAFTEPHAKAPEYGMAYDANADRRSWGATVSFLAEVFGR